jgi:hypothetical protein
MAQPTQLGTIAGMTGLIGVLPLILTLSLAQLFDGLSAPILTLIHMVLMGLGAWVFAAWFGN